MIGIQALSQNPVYSMALFYHQITVSLPIFGGLILDTMRHIVDSTSSRPYLIDFSSEYLSFGLVSIFICS